MALDGCRPLPWAVTRDRGGGGRGDHVSGVLGTLAIVGKILVFAAQRRVKWSVSTFGYALATNN